MKDRKKFRGSIIAWGQLLYSEQYEVRDVQGSSVQGKFIEDIVCAQFPEGNFLGGNCLGDNCPGG